VKRLNTFFRLFWLLPAVAMAAPFCGWAEDLGGSVLRDYPVALTLPKGRLEIDLDYLVIRYADDLFDAEEENVAGPLGPGDLDGLRLTANYGLFRRMTLMSSLQYRDIEYGAGSLEVKTLDFGLKQNLVDKRDLRLPKVALDLGLGFNWADDQVIDAADVQDSLSFQDASDWTASARITTGWVWGSLFPNFFAEYGYTRIEGTMAGPTVLPDAPDLPVSLTSTVDRSEMYAKGGLSLLIKFPYRALLHFEYHFLRLFRDKELEYLKYNHVFKVDFNYYFTRKLVGHIGGIYFRRQLNGEIPFLYNSFTQTSFDRDYGYMSVGLTYLFEF